MAPSESDGTRRAAAAARRTTAIDPAIDVNARMEALACRAVSMAGDRDAAVSWIAERQNSVVTAMQAGRCGLGYEARAGRCRRGQWRRLHRNVFLIGSQPPTPRAQAFAAVASCVPAAAAGGSTAAWLLGGIDRFPAELEVVMLTGRNPGGRAGVRIHRPRIALTEVRWIAGIPVTSPAETLLTLAAESDVDELEAIWALFVRKRVASRGALRTAVERSPPRPGIAKLRSLAAPQLTRSPPERELLRLIRLAALPQPETNVQVGGKEVDMWWPEQRLVVEVDAYGTHGSVEAFERDRWTDTDFDMVGIAVRRFTRRQIQGLPYAVVARLAALLAQR